MQDRLWFSKYINKYANILDKDKYVYLTDNTIHTAKEYDQDIYSDYSIIDKYITQKYNININELKESFGQIIKDPHIIEVLENKLIDYAQENEDIVFFKKEHADKYYSEAYSESVNVLVKFMSMKEDDNI